MKDQQLDSCGQCIKYIMFAMNFVFFLVGGTILGVGIWIIIDRNFMSAILGTELMTVAAYLIIVGGAVVFCIAFIGCIGALMESKVLLIVYLIALVTMFAALLVSGIMMIVLKTKIHEEVREYMREKLQKDYGVNLENRWNRVMTDAWDDAQKTLLCCSVEDQSWALYKGAEWYKIQPGTPDVDRSLVPDSCCQRNRNGLFINKQKCTLWNQGPPAKSGGVNNEALHYRGCFNAGRDFVLEYSGYLIGMAMGVAVALIAGIVFSLLLYRML